MISESVLQCTNIVSSKPQKTKHTFKYADIKIQGGVIS